jgi:non-homologous end joining protein Ku
MSDRAEARLQELRTMSEEFAEAYSDRMYLEEFKKSKLALLMKKAESAGFTSAAAQEREARADSEYIELLDALRVATEQSERLRWHLEVSKLGVAVWQTQQANERAERKVYGA